MTKEEALKAFRSYTIWALMEKFTTDELQEMIDAIVSTPSLPSDLDEAAKEYAKTTFKKPYSDNPDEEVTIVEPDKYAGFIAGAKWQYQKDRD